MTEKYLEAIARDFQVFMEMEEELGKMVGADARETLYLLALRLATTFRAINPRFDSARFITACGM